MDSPAHCAGRLGCRRAYSTLNQLGADLGLKNRWGRNPDEEVTHYNNLSPVPGSSDSSSDVEEEENRRNNQDRDTVLSEKKDTRSYSEPKLRPRTVLIQRGEVGERWGQSASNITEQVRSDVDTHGQTPGTQAVDHRTHSDDHKTHRTHSDDHKTHRTHSDDHKTHRTHRDDHKTHRDDHKTHRTHRDDHKTHRDDHKTHRTHSDDHKTHRTDRDDHKTHRTDRDDHKTHRTQSYTCVGDQRPIISRVKQLQHGRSGAKSDTTLNTNDCEPLRAGVSTTDSPLTSKSASHIGRNGHHQASGNNVCASSTSATNIEIATAPDPTGTPASEHRAMKRKEKYTVGQIRDDDNGRRERATHSEKLPRRTQRAEDMRERSRSDNRPKRKETESFV